MRIKKIGEVTPARASISDIYSTSTTDGYSANYINGLTKYSTTEHRVGTWIDNKPVYRKVIQDTIAKDSSSSGTKSISFTIPDSEFIVNMYGWYLHANVYWTPFNCVWADNMKSVIQWNKNTAEISITIHKDTSFDKPYVLVVEYTKSTD